MVLTLIVAYLGAALAIVGAVGAWVSHRHRVRAVASSHQGHRYTLVFRDPSGRDVGHAEVNEQLVFELQAQAK